MELLVILPIIATIMIYVGVMDCNDDLIAIAFIPIIIFCVIGVIIRAAINL